MLLVSLSLCINSELHRLHSSKLTSFRCRCRISQGTGPVIALVGVRLLQIILNPDKFTEFRDKTFYIPGGGDPETHHRIKRQEKPATGREGRN